MNDTISGSAKSGWLQRMRQGLGRSSAKLAGGIGGLFIRQRLDRALLEQIEEQLIVADLGPAAAARLVEKLAAARLGQEVGETEVREIFAAEIAAILAPVARPLALAGHKPHVVLVVGVNGSGKTTTIGKLAHYYQGQGKSVMLAACDTFRAAAVEQLRIWGARSGVSVIARDTGADAAGLAYDALTAATEQQADLLLIDTAGRLQNKADLMAELEKIVRVIKKCCPGAPHDCLLVLDATTGQNAHAQVDVFKSICQVTGLVLTKLDGSAKGGVLVALAERFGLPVVAIGVGEGAGDLQPFDPLRFARSLLGLSDA